MSLLRFKGKVRLVSEEDMELEEMDMGIIAKSKEWVWRGVAVPIEEIYKVMAYSSNKSIVQMYDGEKILVFESFEELCQRWEKSRTEFQLGEENWPTYNEGDGILGTDDNS
jgi:ABC-type ATPase with predicted acetyltransferase domain